MFTKRKLALKTYSGALFHPRAAPEYKLTTNGVAHQSNFSYNYADGQVLTATDENNRTTTYKYNTPPSGCTTPDGLDRLSEIDYPDNGKTTYCYNDSGGWPTQVRFWLEWGSCFA
jgi:hypothetical protein